MRKSNRRSLKNSKAITPASIADDSLYVDDADNGIPPPSAPPKEQVIAKVGTFDSTTENRRYDLTPVEYTKSVQPSYAIDPWEVRQGRFFQREEFPSDDEPDDNAETEEQAAHSTFLMPSDIHPRMVSHNEEEIAQLRLLAGQLSADWKAADFMAPALARRIRDFQFAQEKRRKKYGDERPWGILGLYEHLSGIRIDVEWAEDAAIRRSNGEPYLSWVEFNESKKGGFNRPWFTYILLCVCTIMMIASIAVNGWKVEPLNVNPMIGPSANTLVKMGAKDSNLIVNENQGWRLVSSTVLHAGFVHYFINMLALWFVGGAIETSHGWIAAMIIFITSAIGGTILSAIFLPQYITVGASGGIFGFIGACLADIMMNWKLLFCDFVTENGKKHRHAIIVLVLFLDIGLNSIIGLTPYVDNFTHLGGMLYGLFCGLSTIERLSSDFFGVDENWRTQLKHGLVRLFGLIVSFVAIITTLIILMQGDAVTTPCPRCTWLSCVPFPPWAGTNDKWWYCDDCIQVTANIISQPYLHLEINCPSGSFAEVNLTSTTVDRAYLEKNLPSYCRSYCLNE